MPLVAAFLTHHQSSCRCFSDHGSRDGAEHRSSSCIHDSCSPRNAIQRVASLKHPGLVPIRDVFVLSSVPNPPPGKGYYAWLLADQNVSESYRHSRIVAGTPGTIKIRQRFIRKSFVSWIILMAHHLP